MNPGVCGTVGSMVPGKELEGLGSVEIGFPGVLGTVVSPGTEGMLGIAGMVGSTGSVKIGPVGVVTGAVGKVEFK